MDQLYITLNNGVKIPQVGYGTFKATEPEEVIQGVLKALEVGYRHIDTASIYRNEESIGEALKLTNVPRSEIFITSKVWNDAHGYQETLDAFEETIKRLGVEYLDLYLIHWPKEKNVETYKALETLYNQGKVRAIGVSNFKIHHLQEILDQCQVVPVVNQVELHPQFPQQELSTFCNKHQIVLEAWGPMMQGRIELLSKLEPIAQKYQKSVTQIALRWSLERGNIVLPKSINENRIKANFDIFDFTLDQSDRELIEKLDTETRIGPDPDLITF